MKPFDLGQHIYRSAANVLDYGSTATPAQATASLLAALVDDDHVYLPGAIYDPVTLVLPNKTLIMGAGVEFRLPDGVVSATAVTGPSVFHVSADDVTIEGDFRINGNKANNSSSSFSTAVHEAAALYVTANRTKFNGRVWVKDAYWMGFVAEYAPYHIDEIKGLYAHRILITDADYHSAMIWSVRDWRIDEIEARSDGVHGPWVAGEGASKDPRIRFGTQTGTVRCREGSVGLVKGDKNVTFTAENGALNLHIDTVDVQGGGKVQNSSGVTVNTWIASDASNKNQAYGWAGINIDTCSIGTIIVQNYDCADGFVGYGVAVDGMVNCKIGTIIVSNSKVVNPLAWDMIVSRVNGLDIDQVILTSPIGGTLGGFAFDYDPTFAPQQDLTIGSMISRGHTGYDVLIENKAPIKIGALNLDATEQYPQNRTNMAVVRKGTWVPTIDRGGAAVTATADGRYEVIGNTVHAHFNIVVGSIEAQGSGYWAISLPLPARASYVNQAGKLMFTPAVAGAAGCYAPSGAAYMFLINAAANDAFNGALVGGVVSGSITYEVD